MNIYKNAIVKYNSRLSANLLRVGLLLFAFLLSSVSFAASDAVCAVVKIEIAQELTLERQAFDAVMRINNGLDILALENVSINVTFKDETGAAVIASSDPNSTTAKFFIRIDSMTGISDVSGFGTVAPKTTAEVRWLIIPAPGAGGVNPAGKLYFIGATLSYNLGGELQTTTVTPDSIYVKPLPLLALDYFLEKDVFADDAFTADVVEPAIPFTLGVRVKNNGAASASGLKIDSAQPKIVENKQGLLIGFNIIGSNVNDQPTTNSLLIDFGEIKPNEASMGRWDMVTTLSGRFIDFTADFSHADALGGRLTSIIDPAGIKTHTLIRNVRVDVAGRDLVRDFLAFDANIYTVYESSGVDTVVTDVTGSSSLTEVSGGTEPTLTLTMPVTAGFSYAKFTDPYSGTKVVKQLVRSDGKNIPLDNVWTSKTRNLNTSPPSWDYFINFFDVNTTGTYSVAMGAPNLGSVAPVFTPLNNITTYETATVSFPVSATDANGDAVILTAGTLPTGATFTSDTSGSGTFTWTPSVGQAGNYAISFTASDGTLNKQITVNIKVNLVWDTDGDGMDDAWEIANFGDLSRDGTGDFDGDGILDLLEYQNNTDPNLVPPLVPTNLVALPGNAENTLNWDTVTGVTSYNIYWSLTADVSPANGTVLNAATSPFVHSGLNNDVTYYYIVTSVGTGGESAGSNVVSVTTGVRDWTTPVNLQSNSGTTFTPQKVQIAMSATGEAIAVWQQTDIGLNSIWSARYVPATGWTIPTLISDNTVDSSAVQIAMDADGNAIAVWQQVNVAQTDIMAARFEVANNTWLTAVAIETDDTVAALNPQIVISQTGTNAGNARVVWQQGATIMSNTFVAQAWQTAAVVATESVTDLSQLTLSMNENGEAFTAWVSTADQTNYDLRVNKFSNNTWATSVVTLATGLDNGLQPAVDISTTGNAVMAWPAFNGVRHVMMASQYDASTGWGVAQSIENSLINPNAADAKSAQVAMDSNGNAFVVWAQSGSPYSIYVNRFDVNTGFASSATLIETRERGDAANPQLVIDNRGNAIVSWQHSDGIQQNILAVVYNNTDSIWSAEQVIETTNTGDAVAPAIAVSDSGNAIVVWQQNNNGELTIAANHFAVGNNGVPNINPIVISGIAQAVDEQTTVTLDGSASFDQDGSIANYAWTQTAGTTVTLTGATTATPSFTSPILVTTEILTFELTVSDDASATSISTVNISVNPVNVAPTANAGVEQNVNEQVAVTLTGSGSDTDGTIDSYSWTQLSGTTVTLATANTATATFNAPIVSVQQGVQTLIFELTVTDNEGATATSQVNVLVSPVNAAPVANAGIDQSVDEKSVVSLTGSASDADGMIATYSWSRVSGLPVTFTGANTANASFTTPTVLVQDGAQTIVLRLTVTDNEGASFSDDVNVVVNAVNALPIVYAGLPQSVDEQTTVFFSVTSADLDGSIVSYKWAQTAGDQVAIINANTVAASFIAPVVLVQNGAQTFSFTLTVTDNEGAVVTSAPVTITVNPVNANPTVNAGLDITVDEQTAVNLTAAANDNDGSIASYNWTQISGVRVTLTNATNAALSFTAPTVLVPQGSQNLVFQIAVTDNENSVATDEVTVTVTPVNINPTVNAGIDQTVDELALVVMAGTASDTDGTIISHEWTQTAGTIKVTMLNANTATMAFNAPRLKTQATLTFRLTVTDNEIVEVFDEVNVIVNPVNTLPIADAGADQTAAETLNVVLDGSASNDPDIDGVISSYQWTQTAGIPVSLSNANTATANFIAPSVYQNEVVSFSLDIVDDESGAASATTNVTLFSTNPDDDADGMADLWEIQYFGNLNRDGKADDDGDGATDLMEYNFGTDPLVAQGPGQPTLLSPDDIEVTTLQPTLIVTNGVHHPSFTTTYQYQVYSDAAMTSLVTEGLFVTEGNSNTAWQVDITLNDNTHYYWRARASGWILQSEWVTSTFFVNTINDAPGSFNISAPQDGVWVKSFSPDLSVTNSTDVDEDKLTYRFEVYADQAMTNLVTSVNNILPSINGTTAWTVDTLLTENTWYTWRAVVTDEHGLSTMSNAASIFINTINDAPSVPALVLPVDGSEIITLSTTLVVDNAIEPEAETVTYFFELDTVNTFDSINKQTSVAVIEGLNQTSWFIDGLLDNTWYYWRVKASDGRAQSAWMNGRFFANTVNDAPGIPTLDNPGDNGWVGTMEPSLIVLPAVDIDEDRLNYEYEIYITDKWGNTGVLHNTAISNFDVTFWQVSPLLPQDGWYYWRARAIDEHGLAGEWAIPVYFFADSDGVNDPPIIKLYELELERKHHEKHCEKQAGVKHTDRDDKDKDDEYENECRSYVEIEWKDYDPDSNAFISLYYANTNENEGGTLIVDGLREDPDHHYDEYKWDVTDLSDGVYFVYAVINDGTTRRVRYSPNAIVVGDGAGQPYMEFTNRQRKAAYSTKLKIKWANIDVDSNASIALYYDTNRRGFDGTLIVDGLTEDKDFKKDRYLWDITTMPVGKYFIYGIIQDETQTLRIYSSVRYKIKAP